jgi:threonine-phosphate decarboxylase
MTATDLHGGNVHAASRELGLPFEEILDFSANINPLGPSASVRRALAQAIRHLTHYPDTHCADLVAALARHFRLPSDCFIVSNGSMEVIHLLPRFLWPRTPPMDAPPVLIIGPTFSEYARAFRQYGVSVIELYADRKREYEPPIQEAIREIERAPLAAIVLTNPNSPTGRAVSTQVVREMLQTAVHRNVWTIVDETFIEYAKGSSIARDVLSCPRLLVLRSFTKFYALPALRLGYAIAAADVVARLKALQPTWSVNALAQVAAVAALSDIQHAKRSRRYMTTERARFADRLGAIPAIKVYPSDANFLLLELPCPAKGIVASLRRHGVLVRDCSAIPGLAHTTIRVAVRTSRQNNRLVRVLKSILAAGT